MLLTMFNKPKYYVSLGDSISIDAYAGGSGRGAASLLYKNREEDFPEWKGRDLSTAIPGIRLIPMAMDGATTANIRYYQMPRLKEMTVRPHVVTVTMGGNDLLQAFGSEQAAEVALKNVRENGSAVLSDLRKMVGDGPILLGTIYDPSDGTGDAAGIGIGAWSPALTFLQRFNATLRELAQEQGAIVSDIHAHFQGHGLSVGNPAQEEARPKNKDLWYCGVIEPNAWGASGLRALWWNDLKPVLQL